MGKYALIIVSTLIFGMITFSHGLKNTLLSSQIQMNQSYELTQAQNIAQSSAMMMVNRIRRGDSTYIPVAGNTLPADSRYESWEDMNGEYRVQVSNLRDTLTVNSFGQVGQTEYKVTVQLDRINPMWNPNLTHAVFAGTRINMDGSAKIVGNVGTNAVERNAVDFDWSTNIEGSLQIGPGGNIENTVHQGNSNNGNVNGEITNLPAELIYDLPGFIDYPDKNNQAPSFETAWNNSGTILSPDYYDGKYIPSLTIKSGWNLTIDTGGQDRTLYVGDLNIQQGDLNVMGDGKLTVIAENKLTLNGSSTFNKGRDQEDVFVYYGGTDEINFGGSTNFNSSIYAKRADFMLGGSGGIQGHVITGGDHVTIAGAAEAISRVVYAPNAEVELTGSGSVRGSVISDTFSAGGATSVTFEEDHSSALPDIKLGKGKTRILSWN